MTSSVDAARMIDALEEALQSSRHTYDRHVQRKMFVEALHKSGFHITPIEQAASNPAWSRLGMTEAEGEVLDEVVEQSATNEQLKVGESVLVVNGAAHYLSGFLGRQAKIIQVDKFDQALPYRIRFDTGYTTWVFPTDIKRVTPIKERAS